MNFNSLIQKIGASAASLSGRKAQAIAPPVLEAPLRFPYGPFRFKCRIPKGIDLTVLASTDLRTWSILAQDTASDAPFEFMDSEAFKFSYRFYRVLAREVPSTNLIGYASCMVPPGFSMLANPFDSPDPLSDTFKDWPDGTTINRFDTRLFRLVENAVKSGKWTDTTEKLAPGEGAIFFNSTEEYKSVSFAGDLVQGNLSLPIPAGFSVRSSLVPQPGNLADDLKFPIANGDVIHLFDRERQKYVLHPFENGKWLDGPPVISVGESFWVAKTQPGNWTRYFAVE